MCEVLALVVARVGVGGVAPYADVEGNDVEIAGHLADLIDRLERAMLMLSVPSTNGRKIGKGARADSANAARPD